ncbi:MAG TPA: carboxypeptidase-like regulatory domain-containing protein [Vicinamibacterales bacterium]|nr:carboxypeptidase-like regulatory domain-containing protein [Vicinamibacterales bacterium]
MVHRVLRRGRVVDSQGRPVAGALVSVTWGTAPTPEIGRRTDDAGSFHVGLPPGRFRLQAIAVDGRTGETEVEGGSEIEIVIRLD